MGSTKNRKLFFSKNNFTYRKNRIAGIYIFDKSTVQSNNRFSESAGLERLGKVGEEVNDEELSLVELLLTKPEDNVLGDRLDAVFDPIIFSDIFGGTLSTIFPEWVSEGWEETLHLQPVAVHL